MNTTKTVSLKPTGFGSIITATLRSEDLIPAFLSELEWQISRNGAFLSLPENFPMRDRLARVVGNAQDAFEADGETLKEDCEDETIGELVDALSEFAPAYGYFGAHVGDGSDFGFWVDVDSVREQVEFVSSREQSEPDAAYRGEWLEVNDHGNATLYVREDNTTDAFAKDGYVDRELWAIV